MASHGRASEDRQESCSEMQHRNRFVFIYDRRIGDKAEIKLQISDTWNHTIFKTRVKKVWLLSAIYAS